MFEVVPKAIYEKVFEILDTDGSLSYIVTRQKGFDPRDRNVLAPTQYPWAFIEFGGYTGVECIAAPRVWSYEFTVPLVAMTFADKGDATSLVFNDGTNEKKGIGDLVADIGGVFWAYKPGGFDVDGIRDWNIARVGTPSVMGVQYLLMNPLLRGVQMDFVFKIVEKT